MMITLIAAQFVCSTSPIPSRASLLPTSLSNLPSADPPWVFSCNYAERCVIGFHGEFLKQTLIYVIGEWLIDLRDLGVALIMCPRLTFDPSLCSMTTQQTVVVIVVELRRRWVFLYRLQTVPSSFHPLSSQSHSTSDLTDMKHSPSVH